MHSYSTDEKRINVMKYIGLISVLLTSVFVTIINWLVDYINKLSYIDLISPISIIAIFGFVFLLVFYLFDRYLWKISKAGLKLSKIPNLNGVWKGKIQTNYVEGMEIDADVEIKQTWSSISIVLKTKNSKSSSEVAFIATSKSQLIYHYFNQPSNISDKNLHKHYGTVFLDLEGNDNLNGFYFTDRDRKTQGNICLNRTSGSVSKML